MQDQFRGMRDEVLELRRRLDRKKVEHEDHNEITYFENGDGDCTIFPSIQHDGRLFVTYTASDYCDTVDEALRLCGLGKDAR